MKIKPKKPKHEATLEKPILMKSDDINRFVENEAIQNIPLHCSGTKSSEHTFIPDHCRVIQINIVQSC